MGPINYGALKDAAEASMSKVGWMAAFAIKLTIR